MTLSLRGRLLIGVISLVVVGLLVSNVATYALLRNSLVGRVDAQLNGGSGEARAALGAPQRGAAGPPSQFPTGTVVELIGLDGSVVNTKVSTPFGATPSSARPVLPKSLPNNGMDNPSSPFTVAGTGGVSEFRVTDWPEDSFNGQIVVLAIPLNEVNETLRQLLLLEGLISVAVVLTTAFLALLIIDIGLRP